MKINLNWYGGVVYLFEFNVSYACSRRVARDDGALVRGVELTIHYFV